MSWTLLQKRCINMEMNRSLLASFILHAVVLGFVFCNTGTREVIVPVAQVSFVDLGPQRVARLAEKEGRKKPKLKKAPEKARPQKPVISKEGNGKKNVAAQKASGGRASQQATVTYAAELVSFIDRNQFYPRRALMMGQTGMVKVKLIIDREGRFQKVEILEKAPHESLNQAAESLFAQLGSFKPLPESYEGNGEFVVPLNYRIRRRGI